MVAEQRECSGVIWTGRIHIVLSLCCLIILFAGLGTWAGTARISGAIVAAGRVAVESNKQVVQHPNGGVVEAIFVRDGDKVNVGDPLIRLDPSQIRSERRSLTDRLHDINARVALLEAERDGVEVLTFSDDLIVASIDDPEVALMLEGQRTLFFATQDVVNREIEQLVRRKDQIRNQVDAISAQQNALKSQLKLLREELLAQQSLLSRGLAQAPRVLALQREEASLLGQEGSLTANIAELEGQSVQIDLEVLKMRTRARETAIADLRDLQVTRMELVENLRATDESLSRLTITAPMSGVVMDMQFFAERSVVRSAESILYIVPQHRPLVIQTRVNPIHIDQVFPGQPVTLRLPAFDAHITPELFGMVVNVSPDALTDPATGETYYRAEVLPNNGEMAKLGAQVLLPGMPVEAYLKTDNRTPLAYLFKPLGDYFNRAFRG